MHDRRRGSSVRVTGSVRRMPQMAAAAATVVLLEFGASGGGGATTAGAAPQATGQAAASPATAPRTPSTASAALATPASSPVPDPAALELAARTRAARKLTSRYDPYFRKYSKRYFGAAFDWRLFKAQGVAESELNPRAVSPVGARGLMQVMPATFAYIARSQSSFTSVDAPEWNIAAGILYDRDLWRRWEPAVAEGECFRFTFASYNAGDGTISRAANIARAAQLDPTKWTSVEQVAPNVKRWRHEETLGYVRKIERTYEALRAIR